MSSKKKILLLCRSLNHKGGVVKHCTSILKYYRSDSFAIEHFIIGKRPQKESNIYYVFTTFYDIIRLFFKLFNKKYILVHINPSLGLSPVLRDSCFLLIAKLHSRKILVFWHGWEKKFEALIDNSAILNKSFRKIFNKADAFIVLASSFKNKFRDWGFNKEIFADTTAVDNNLLNGFSPAKKVKDLKGSRKLQILFFSRIEISKGIFETVDAFLELDQIDREVELVIAGDGPDYNQLTKRVRESGDNRIKLVGYVTGGKKRKILESSHMMCLPTTHGEGLPVAILEAMAFAMPVLTRPVGGIPDIFNEGENGYYIRSFNKTSLSKLLMKIISDKQGMARIAKNNYNLAKERFLASIVSTRLDNIYHKVVNAKAE